MTFIQSSLKIALAALLAAIAPDIGFAQGAPSTSTVPRPQEIKNLVATLQSPTAADHEKVVACHRLAVIGTKEAVPALAALLADPKFAHYARHALEPMTDPAAGAVLRDALGKLHGSLLVGVINTIGFRRDAQASAALGRLLGSSETDVSTAAAAALGRIGSVDAAKRLQEAMSRASGPLQIAFADASLTCADNLMLNGKRTEAAAIYDGMHGFAFPPHIRTAAMWGAITAREARGVPLLLKQVEGDDPAMQAAAWRAARELPGASVTKALAAELGKVSPEKQGQLIKVLGDRGDRAALPAVIEYAEKGDDKVRVTALQVLPRVDDGKSGPAVLLRTITSGRSAAETDVAFTSLALVGGNDTNAKILAALPSVAPALRARLIGVLGMRRADNARGELLKLAAAAEPEIRKAAFRALGQVGRPADLPELIRLSATCRDEGLKVPADLAVVAVSMKITPADQRADPVLNALQSARDAETKRALLRPLGAIVKATGGSAQTLDTLKASWKDSDPEVRTMALRSLADWPDARPAHLLLEIVQGASDPIHRELALRGGVRMAANVASGRDGTRLDALAWLEQANRAVRTTEDKLAIVSGLGSLKQVEGLRMLLPYLEDPAVRTEAELAVVEIASSLANTSHADLVKGVLQKITKTTKDADIRRRAAKTAKGIPSKS